MPPFGRPLGASDDFVCDKDDTVTEGPGVDEAHGFLAACLAEQVLASPEHDGEDLQPHLVHEVVLYQRAHELEATRDDDFPVQLLLQFRDLIHRVSGQDCRVVQWASSSVDDTTYLGRLFNLSAKWPLRDGHRAANHS